MKKRPTRHLDDKMLTYEARLRALSDGTTIETAKNALTRERSQAEALRAEGARTLQKMIRAKTKSKKRGGKDHAPQHVYGLVGSPLRGGAPGLGKRK